MPNADKKPGKAWEKGHGIRVSPFSSGLLGDSVHTIHTGEPVESKPPTALFVACPADSLSKAEVVATGGDSFQKLPAQRLVILVLG